MTTSREPDYTRYTLEQLERARRSIDVERFPERTKILDILIADRKARAAEAAQAASTTSTPAAAAAADDESFFGSHKETFTFKTPGQVLLGIAGSIIMTFGGGAMMLIEGEPRPAILVFLGVWVLLGVVQLGHLVLEYRRLKREAGTGQPHQHSMSSGLNADAKRTKLTNSNQSPIQRL